MNNCLFVFSEVIVGGWLRWCGSDETQELADEGRESDAARRDCGADGRSTVADRIVGGALEV